MKQKFIKKFSALTATMMMLLVIGTVTANATNADTTNTETSTETTAETSTEANVETSTETTAETSTEANTETYDTEQPIATVGTEGAAVYEPDTETGTETDKTTTATTSMTATAANENSETVKTGEFNMIPIIVGLVIVAAVTGGAYMVCKKKK